MNRIIFLIVFPALLLITACENLPEQQAELPVEVADNNELNGTETSVAIPETAPTAPMAPETAGDVQTVTENADATGEADIQSIQDKFASDDEMLSGYSAYDCAQQGSAEEFICQCSFSPGGSPQEESLFAWDMDKTACVKVNGQLNSLYPDWEERDYKGELKELANSKNWVSASGTTVTYFGKSLADYKYSDPVAFLTDVILASGRDISVIPIQTTTGGVTFDQAKANTVTAVAKAKAYKAKGGADPLNIVKMDNRSYDVIVRYRQLTQYEGESNEYEGTITLLKNRGTEILETRTIKGTCGC